MFSCFMHVAIGSSCIVLTSSFLFIAFRFFSSYFSQIPLGLFLECPLTRGRPTRELRTIDSIRVCNECGNRKLNFQVGIGYI